MKKMDRRADMSPTLIVGVVAALILLGILLAIYGGPIAEKISELLDKLFSIF